MKPRDALTLACLLATCALSCGAGHRLRVEHRQLIARPKKPAGVHLRLSIDHAHLTRVIDRLLGRSPLALDLALPPLGVGKLHIRALRLAPANTARSRDVALALRVDVDTPLGVVRNLSVHATAPLSGVVEGDKLLVGPRLSEARQVGVTWPDGWRQQLTGWLADKLPGGLLRELARAAIGPAVQKLSDLVVLGATKLARLAWRALDAHLRVKIRLPRIGGQPLPLLGLAIRAGPRAIEIDVRTALSTWSGVLDAGPARAAPARLTLAGPVAAAVLHEAMRKGALPMRYNTSAKADPKGSCRLAFGWDEATGELRVHVFKLSSPAGRLTLGGPLRAEMGTSGKLKLSAAGLQIKAKDGDFLFELGVWLTAELWGRTFQFMRDLVIPERIAIGRASLRPAVRAIHFTQGAVHVDLEPNLTIATDPASEK